MTSPRLLIVVLTLTALAACQPAVPEDSRFGVGFDQTFDAQRVNRDTALSTGVPVAPTVTGQTIPVQGSAADTAAQTTAILAQTRQTELAAATNSGVAPLEASPDNPAPAVVNSATGISQENNFDAVSGQRSIESDAARLAANRAQYQVIQPQALPERTETGPNIVAFALQTSHPVGTKLYPRSGFFSESRFRRSCGNYRHMDQAQADFLAAGGPERDRKGMDPDGDGYACGWDPSVFRS